MGSRRAPSFATAVHAELVRIAKEHGLDESRATQIAARFVERIALQYRGTEAYVRQPPRYDEVAVLADFNHRDNHDEVCLKHGISRRTLYRIIARRNLGCDNG